MGLLWLFSILQIIGGIILVLGYPIQIAKLWKTKSARDFSLPWVACVAFGLAFMEIYAIYLGLHGQAYAYLATNSLCTIVAWWLLVMVWWYRKKEER